MLVRLPACEGRKEAEAAAGVLCIRSHAFCCATASARPLELHSGAAAVQFHQHLEARKHFCNDEGSLQRL